MRSLVRRSYASAFHTPSHTNTVSACIGASNELYVIAQSSPSSFQIFRCPPPSPSAGGDQGDNIVELANFNTSAPAKLVRAQYLAETETLVLCFDAGELVQVALEAEAENYGQAEVVGEIEERIDAATWSPDEELLALITGANKLLLFTKDFDVLSEGLIQTHDFGEAKPVNVGWGSADTQFRGSIGKAAARPTAETSATDVLQPETDDLKPQIAWRGDSAHFAVSTAEGPGPDQLRRVLRFFSRTAVLQSTAEQTPGLEHPLAWQPSGSIIASTSRSAAAPDAPDFQRDVIFYERNGLRRYDFPLVTPQAVVKRLLWSPDSALLALWVHHPAKGTEAVQLCCRNNYHWYTKQSIDVPKGTPLADVFFHPDNALQLYLLTSEAVSAYTFQWDVLDSRRAAPHDSGLVAVVDGLDLQVTPLRYENVPPPMSSYRLSAPKRQEQQCIPVHAAYSTDDDLLVALYADRSYDVWHCFPAPKPQAQSPQLMLTGHLDITAKQELLQLAVKGSLQEGRLHLATLCASDDITTLWISSVDLKSQQCHTFEPILGEGLEQVAAFSNGFVSHDREGKIHAVSVEGDELDKFAHAALPEPCAKIAAVEVPPSHPAQIVGMTSSGRLYAGSRLLSAEATSFVVCGTFLIFSTLAHTARFIALTDLSAPEGKVSDFDPSRAQARRLERGSRIVAGIASSMTLVLQMPRGNLETICPRPLVLQVVMQQLDQLQFREAFVNCRKHRIDLNILVDHDPNTAIANLALLTEQIPEVDHLNLFVSAMADEDSAVVTYPSDQHAEREPGWASGKTNTVCTRIREILAKKDLLAYINTILTTHLCESPPDPEAALQTLASFRKTHPEEVDDAVKYIVFLADVNQLFDVALGLYDFSLTLLVAQSSQKDPKEYLPFLKELKSLETNIQRHRIDDHLRRHPKALAHLVAAGPDHFEEVKQYVEIHRLYSDALVLYADDAPKLRAIHFLHGEYLYGRNKYDQAALSFTLALDRDRAIDAHTLATNWQQCFSLALAGAYPGQGPIAVEKIAPLALDLSQRLKSASQYKEAARVLLDYGRDIEASIQASCEGADFDEALRNATLYSRQDLVQSSIAPSVLDHTDSLMESMTELRGQVEKQQGRIAELDALRQQDIDAYFGEVDLTAMEGVDVDDSASTAAGTGFTRYTKQTSISKSSRASTGYTAKSRRKEERKKASGGKRGTVWEEEYLLGSLSRTVETRLPSLQNDVSSVLPLLLSLGGASSRSGTTRAKALQDALYGVEKVLTDAVDAVWGNNTPRSAQEYEAKMPPAMVKKPTVSSKRWALEQFPRK